MGARSKGDAERFRSLAKRMFFSNETVEAFLSGSSAAQVRSAADLIGREMEVRERNKRERLYRKAAFPQVKSFEGYDFSQVAFPEGYGPGDLMSLAFVDSAQDFVFHGQTGRGKTHLAIAVGNACVRAGRTVRFFSTAQLVLMLTRASREHALEAVLKDIAKADLVILDEFGYVPLDVEGARLLFQVMSSCYEKRSVIVTTNIEFSKWGTVLGDDKLAAAKAAGATYAINTRNPRYLELLRELGGGTVLFDTTGAAKALRDCVSVLKKGARILLVAYGPGREVHLDMADVVLNEFEILGSRGVGIQDVAEIMSLIERKKYAPIVQRYPLSEINEVIDKLNSNKLIGRAVLIP